MRGLALPRPPAQHSCKRGHRDPGGEQPHCQDRARRRQERGGRPNRDRPGQQSHEGRTDAAQVKVLERVHVRHHAREQVALGKAPKLGRCERLDPPVDAGAHVAKRAQCHVVRDETLAVASHRAGEPEEADRDDRGQEREDRGLLGCAGDEIAGRRHQAHSEEHGQGGEDDRDREPRARRADEREEPAQFAHQATSRAGRAIALPCSSRTTRSARSSSPGLWPISSTVRSAQARSTASATT